MHCMRMICAIATTCVVTACATEPARDPAAVLLDATTRVDVVKDTAGAIDWHETALAGSPRLQRLRAELAAASARVGGAGASSIVLDAEVFDADGGAAGQVGVWLDPIAIAGFGKVALRHILAEQHALLSASRLERERGVVLEQVDTARWSLAAMRVACERLDALRDEARRGFERVRTIASAGGLGDRERADAEAAAAALDAACARAHGGESDARAALAIACGLPVDAPPILRHAEPDATAALAHADALVPTPATIEAVIAAHPDLDAPRLELAVAEAEFRIALRARWPDLRLGPAVAFTPDAALPGGLLAVDLPQPVAAQHEVEAARQRREAAVAALREAALVRLADVRANERERAAAGALLQAAEREHTASALAMRSATLRFAADRRAREDWLAAVLRHAAAIAELGDARAASARAVARARRLLVPEFALGRLALGTAVAVGPNTADAAGPPSSGNSP